MTAVMIMLGWVAAVAIVGAIIVRPWNSPAARARLPLALAALAAGWVLANGIRTLGALMAEGSWTAASVTIAVVPIKASVYMLLAYAAGRTFVAARASGAAGRGRWVAPALLALLVSYLVVSDIVQIRENALVRRAADPALSAGDAGMIAQRVRSGAALKAETMQFLGNPLCPPEMLAEYAAAPDPELRRAVARNESVSDSLAETLAGDGDEQVRYMLAFNRSLPPPLLARLASDSSEMVRETVAWTDGLPDEAFARLVEDPSPKVRATAALQRRLSPEDLARLKNDPEQRVRDAANRWAGN